MDSRLPISPLPPHRGRHAGIIAIGLLVATTAVVWSTHQRSRPSGSSVAPRPVSAAATVPRAAEQPPLAPFELGAGGATAVVAERALPRVVAANGAVTFDESRTHHVRTPVAGALVKARPSSLGRVVRAGETVGVVYSLEVYLATVDLVAQLRDFRSQDLVDRARRRLLRWGMRPQQVARIERAMRPSAELPLVARVTGRVVAEKGAPRQLIDPSIGDLMTITDPAYAVIYVDIPVADAELLQVGQTTRVTVGTMRPIAAPIGYISESVYGETRTVRIDLHPVPLQLPTDVAATIELARATARGPAVPEAAVVRDGERSIVYVVRGEVAEPRDVRLGPASDGYVLIEAGVAAGETIAIPR